jgi:hypothetical protein
MLLYDINHNMVMNRNCDGGMEQYKQFSFCLLYQACLFGASFVLTDTTLSQHRFTQDNETKKAPISSYEEQAKHEVLQGQPNTALFCLILALGTFFIAYYLRQFRNSKFLGRSVSTSLCIRFYNRNVCTGCISELGDFRNVMNSKCFHSFSFNTYEHGVYIKEFRFFKFLFNPFNNLTHRKQKSSFLKITSFR